MKPTSEERLKQINKEIEKSLEGIFRDDGMKRFLETMAIFPHYSVKNILLILTQKKDSKVVMNFNKWKKLNRTVRKGEKALWILAPKMKNIEMEKIDSKTGKPILGKDGKPVTEKQRVLAGFYPTPVFDISQTDGEPLVTAADLIKGELQESSKITNAYKQLFEDLKRDYTMVEEVFPPNEKGVGGFFDRSTNTIAINGSETNASKKFSVLIHEYAHAQLHHSESEYKDLPRGHKESQAECVAFAVSKYFGLDTDGQSAGYIASWSQDFELAKQALQEIQSTVKNTIYRIEQIIDLPELKLDQSATVRPSNPKTNGKIRMKEEVGIEL